VSTNVEGRGSTARFDSRFEVRLRVSRFEFDPDLDLDLDPDPDLDPQRYPDPHLWLDARAAAQDLGPPQAEGKLASACALRAPRCASPPRPRR